MKKIWLWLISPAVAGIIGIVGLALAIYTSFFYERKPDISISIDAISKVFDLHRPVGGLDIYYSGDNLRSSKKNLWVLTATVKNTGNAEIRKSDYDEKAPLGFEVVGAVVAELPVFKSSIDYVGKNLTVNYASNSVSFSPIILEPGDSYEVTVLLLGADAVKPYLKPIGKLAGVKSINLFTPENPSSGKSIVLEAVDATSLWVHPIRWLFYFFGTFVVIALIVALVSSVSLPFERRREREMQVRRQKQVQGYKRHEGVSPGARYLMDRFVVDGQNGLAPVAEYLKIHNERRVLFDELVGKLDQEKLTDLVCRTFPLGRKDEETEKSLRAEKLVEDDGALARVVDGLKTEFDDLCDFLEIDPEKIGIYQDYDEQYMNLISVKYTR